MASTVIICALVVVVVVVGHCWVLRLVVVVDCLLLLSVLVAGVAFNQTTSHRQLTAERMRVFGNALSPGISLRPFPRSEWHLPVLSVLWWLLLLLLFVVATITSFPGVETMPFPGSECLRLLLFALWSFC